MITRESVVQAARAWMGTPFVHQGRTKRGCDCVGLLVHSFGVRLDVPDYGERPEPERLISGLQEHCYPVSKDELCTADILLLRIELDPQHLALVTETVPRQMMIHSLRRRRGGHVVEHSLDEKWRSRIIDCFRFRGIE